MKWFRSKRGASRKENQPNDVGDTQQNDTQRDQGVQQQEVVKESTSNYILINENEAETKNTAKQNWAILRDAVFRRRYPRPRPKPEPKSLQDAEKDLEQPTFRRLAPMLIALLGYIGVGIVVYCVGEGWPVRDATYFIVVTLLTVGYGDLSPTTAGMKIFTMIFASTGVGLLGAILGIVTQVFVKMQLQKLEEVKAERANDVMQQFEVEDDHNNSNEGFENKREPGFRSFLTKSQESKFLVPLAHVFVIMVVGTTVLSLVEGWSPLDALYWTFVTTTTIGYGDNVPESNATRWFSIFFLPLAVAVITEVLGDIASSIANRGIDEAQQDLFNSKVTVHDLIAMDVDGDGHVTKLEYFEFMLKAMKKVDQDLLDKLHAQFAELDADQSGTLEVSDLEILARRGRGLDRSKRAMELSAYKSRLLELGSQPAKQEPTGEIV